MLTAQIITIAVIAVALIATYIVLKCKGIAIPDISYKILSGVLAMAFFLRYMWDRDTLQYILALEGSTLATDELTIIALLANWALYSVVVLAMLLPFYRNSKMSMLLRYYGTAVVLFYLINLQTATVGILGADSYTEFSFRTLLLGIELGALVGIIGLEWARVGAKSKLQDLWALVFIFGMLIASMPPYMIQALWGYSNTTFEVSDLILSHRLIIYGAIALPLLLYVLLKGRNAETIRCILTYICICTWISFAIYDRFPDLTELSNWPLHLCNTAMYIIPLCLIFRMKKVFYFTYFINVLGAAVALLIPSYGSANILSTAVVKFYIVHYMAFFMPVLMVALGVYERPKLPQFKYSMIAFAVYFVFILGVNAYCTNFNADVDFFFLNGDFVINNLGSWAKDLLDTEWMFSIGELDFIFYPVYQSLFFAGYVAAGAGMWFLYEGLYMLEDTMLDMTHRTKKIRADRLALEVSLAGKTKEDPMNSNIADKLVLQSFSKRYGTSSHYAVKDANLEVCAGDVFGFLGHNGAGKSTIIKSIVGIQPITSGAISVCGYDVDKQSVMAKKCIGFVPDHYALYEKLSGREYLNYIADLYDVPNEQRNKEISHYVNLFHLEGAIDNQIKTYSHGMKQKVTIMSALIHNPKLWILDEPLTGLDPDSIMQVKQCMRDHASKGNIVFFSSHLIDIVETVCNKIAIIAKGEILVRENVADVLAQGRLEDYYRVVTEKATNNGMDMAGNLVDSKAK